MHKAQRSRHNFCVCSFLVSFGRRECAAERPDLLRQQQKKCRQRRRNSTQGVLPRMGPNFPKGKFSKRRSRKGFNFVCAKPPLRRAESRFGKPREVPKGFNFVRANLLFGCAASRFAEPRISLQGRTVLFFSLVRKERGVPQRFANLWTPGTIQISARFEILAEMTSHHHVTGHTGHCNLPGYRR